MMFKTREKFLQPFSGIFGFSFKKISIFLSVSLMHVLFLLPFLFANETVEKASALALMVDFIPAAAASEKEAAPQKTIVEKKTKERVLPSNKEKSAAIDPNSDAPSEVVNTAESGSKSNTSDSHAQDGALENSAAENSAVSFSAEYLKNPKPPYPPLARRVGAEGRVLLRVLVSSEGLALNVEIRDSSGDASLDESAQKTVRHWRFIPAKRRNQSIESHVLIPINFKLER